jgi:hypothetical protein
LSLALPFGGVLEPTFQGKPATSHTVTIEPERKAAAMPSSAPFSQGFNHILWLPILPIFVDFYERHRRWVKHNYGEQRLWPNTYYFARLVRNAISHGGCLQFDHDPKRTAEWQHLKYRHADQGVQIIGAGGAFSVADLFCLMLDTSEELDRLKCPVNPA